ncbi:MAG: SDR family oxidoreductase [Candidatus Hydrogenedentes bacterium]|nr:SDR family oxidoreductase [Candidatus Hydrogenedentota bacterium]
MSKDTTDMNGKTCLVTGANSGIGKATAAGLAAMGATVVMVCRDAVKGETALNEIITETGSQDVSVMIADLASLKSIREFAANFLDKHERLDVLINNAAIMPTSRTETSDGFETQFGVNHLAPFLLTHLLLDLLKASAPSRIVNVSSTLHHKATLDLDDLQYERNKYRAMQAYGRSKLANILFTYELARRLKGTGVTANCLHPGVVRTSLMRDLPFFLQPLLKIAGMMMLSPSGGARTSVHVATSPDLEGVTGEYFDKCAVTRSSSVSHDAESGARLWEISAELTHTG